MSRQKKESEFLHCRLEKKISEATNELCEKTGLTKTMAVERALKMYIEHFKETGKV